MHSAFLVLQQVLLHPCAGRLIRKTKKRPTSRIAATVCFLDMRIPVCDQEQAMSAITFAGSHSIFVVTSTDHPRVNNVCTLWMTVYLLKTFSDHRFIVYLVIHHVHSKSKEKY